MSCHGNRARLVRIYSGRVPRTVTVASTIRGGLTPPSVYCIGGDGDVRQTQVTCAFLPFALDDKEVRITNAPSFFLTEPHVEDAIVCESPLVSYIHCVISYGRVFDYKTFRWTNDYAHCLLDMNSQHGTFINGERVSSHQAVRLFFGDIISLGVPHFSKEVRLYDPKFCLFRYEADNRESNIEIEFRYFGANGTVSTLVSLPPAPVIASAESLPSPGITLAKPSAPAPSSSEGMQLRSKRMKKTQLTNPKTRKCAKRLKFALQERPIQELEQEQNILPTPKTGQFKLTPSVTLSVESSGQDKDTPLSMLAEVAADEKGSKISRRYFNRKVPPTSRLTASEEFFKRKLSQTIAFPLQTDHPQLTQPEIDVSELQLLFRGIQNCQDATQGEGSRSFIVTGVGAKPILLKTRTANNSNSLHDGPSTSTSMFQTTGMGMAQSLIAQMKAQVDAKNFIRTTPRFSHTTTSQNED